MRKLSAHRFISGVLLLFVTELLSLPASASGQLAIIIDDIGYNLALGKRSADLNGDFTLAVLPFTPHKIKLTKHTHHQNKKIIQCTLIWS